MKSLTEQLWFEVPGRRGFVNITDTVAALVRKSGVQEGLCLVNAMHITASVFINDAEEECLLYRKAATPPILRRFARQASLRGIPSDSGCIRDCPLTAGGEGQIIVEAVR